MRFNDTLSYVVDALTDEIEALDDPRLRKARELVLDVALWPRRRWWRRFWR